MPGPNVDRYAHGRANLAGCANALSEGPCGGVEIFSRHLDLSKKTEREGHVVAIAKVAEELQRQVYRTTGRRQVAELQLRSRKAEMDTREADPVIQLGVDRRHS